MVEISQKVLEAAKKRLIEKKNEWEGYDGGVCQGCVWDLDGKELQAGHSACHSWVGYEYRKQTGDYGWSNTYKKGAKPFLTLTCHSRKLSKASQEATDAIILWMASDESPFSQFILNRDDPKSLTEGGAIILCGPDGGATQAQCMWMCKVLRYTTEGSKALDVWKTLYDAGVNPLLAVLVCTYISAIKGATFTAASVSTHVSVFNTYAEKLEDASGLMSFKFNPDANSTPTLFNDVKGDLAFGKKAKPLANKADVEATITGFCTPYEKDDGWGGKIKGTGVEKDELIAKVLKWQEELGGYDRAAGKFPAPKEEPVPLSLPTASTVYLDIDL